MPEYFYLRPETFEVLSELGLSSACACVCLRVELILHSEYFLRCSSKGDTLVDLRLAILVDRDGADIVLVARLHGEDCSRPAPRHPCG